MKDKFTKFFMEIAHSTAKLSTATKAQVGAVIVKDDRIISIGYNGMPAGWTNECEEWIPNDGVNFKVHEKDRSIYGHYKSKPEVLHAEANAITKLAKSTESGEGATMFTTHLPCIECAKLLYQSGIETVYYDIEYNASKGKGKEFLQKSGVQLKKSGDDDIR